MGLPTECYDQYKNHIFNLMKDQNRNSATNNWNFARNNPVFSYGLQKFARNLRAQNKQKTSSCRVLFEDSSPPMNSL